jgi:hypothetical protein
MKKILDPIIGGMWGYIVASLFEPQNGYQVLLFVFLVFAPIIFYLKWKDNLFTPNK